MRKILTLLMTILALGLLGARAQSTEDQYIRIYGIIQDGDRLVAEGKDGEAVARYQEARGYLQGLQRGNPGWNEKIVKFRLTYLTRQMESLSAKVQPPAPALMEENRAGGAKPTRAGGPATNGIPELEQQVGALRDQLRQLQGDKAALELKLKESLAVQPAAMDPRELAKAESKLQSLQKENELLKVTLDQEKGRGTTGADSAAVAAAKVALDEANAKLASQTARADKLEQEQKALQGKLAKVAPSTWNAAEIEKTQKELVAATSQVKEQKELITRLTVERDALQTRLKTQNGDAEAALALRQENELLKKQLADLKAAGGKGRNGDAAIQLAEARAQVAALQSDKQVLQLERTALENRVRQLAASSNSAPALASVPPPYQTEDPSRIKQLEKDRRNLESQLAAARKELANRRSKTAQPGSQDLEKQVAGLQARLQVLEATPVPYTAAELALFSSGSSKTGAVAQASAAAPPAGTSEMIAEARRSMGSGQFDKAEQTYQEILKRDQKNVYTLAHLASIQVSAGKLEEAEKNLLLAQEQTPNDAFTLSVLGQLRYQQGKYDEAFEAFSRAAQLDPKSADIQNFLGATLSHKGMRVPAQSAFRRAIQLSPDYADAHQNLAVSYLSQTPPLVELARYHYQKALAAGYPRNEAFEKELESKKAK